MVVEVRSFEGLGRFENDWLSGRFHFSFADYQDPERMGVGPLIVWNDDTIQPGRGFDTHPHGDMEIITYMRRGAITHRDDLGNTGRTEAGDVQVMSAGAGIRHSEHNLEADISQLFQIWILPDQTGLKPRWETRRFPKQERRGVFQPLASGEPGIEGVLKIHQDATLYGAVIDPGKSVAHQFDAGRQAYLVVASGQVEINGLRAEGRSGTLIRQQSAITIKAAEEAEVLLFDLPDLGPAAWR